MPYHVLLFVSVLCVLCMTSYAADPQPEAPVARSYLVTAFDKECVLAASAGDALRNGVWHIDFAASNRAAMSGSLSLFHKPRTLTMRLRASAPGARLVIQFGAHFQNFTRTIAVLDGTDQTITFTVPPDGWEASGAAHTTLHYPLRLSGIIIERGDCAAERLDVTLGEVICETETPPGEALILMSRLRAAPPKDGKREFTLWCDGWNLLDAAVTNPITVHVANWGDAELHRTEIPATLPAGGKRLTVEYLFSVPAKWRYVDVTCSIAGGGQHPAQALSAYTAPLEEAGFEEVLPTPETGLTPESPWGMGLYFYSFPHNEAGLADMERAAALAQQAGVKWSREEFNYGMIEKAPGVYDFSFFDALVDVAQRHGISIYGLLSYWSPFIENPYSEEGIAAYCHYARAVVNRYKDRIHHWEIYNEPNIFFWEGPKELYPELLKRAYAAIKEEDPTAQVLGISTAGIDRGFIRMVLKAEAPFDALTIHPYRSQLVEEAFIRELEHAAILVQNRPVWITEMGWSTQVGTGGKTEREQAQLLARCYLAAVGAGIRNMVWYNFREYGNDPFYNEGRFGVMRPDLTPKAAYRALAAVCRIMAVSGDMKTGWRPGGNGAQGVYALGAGENTGIWAPDAAMEVVLESAGTSLSAVNLMGEPLPLEIQATLPPLPLPARGCRSSADMTQQSLPRRQYALELSNGNPVFILGGEVEIVAAAPKE